MNYIYTILRTLAYLLIGLLLILLLLLGVLQTSVGKEMVRHIAQKEINKALNAQLDIGGIDGNFLTQLEISKLSLHQDHDTILSLPHLKISYRLLPLLHGRIEVDSIKLQQPIVSLRQLTDSTWNFEQIAPPKDPTDTVSSSFDMAIELGMLQLINGKVEVNMLDTTFSQTVDSIGTKLSLHYSEEKKELDWQSFHFLIPKQDVRLKKMTLFAKIDEEGMSLKNCTIQTTNNWLNSQLSYTPQEEKESFAQLHTKPIDVEEFEFLLPSMHIPIRPQLHMDTHWRRDSTLLQLIIADKNQKITIDAFSDNLVAVLQKEQVSPIRYEANLLFENIQLSQWTGDDTMQYDFSGNVHIKGEGVAPEKMATKLVGRFDNINLKGRKVEKVDVNIAYRRGNATATVGADGDWGVLQLQSNIKSLLTKHPRYTATLNIHQLDLAELLLDSVFDSKMQLQANLKGRGFNPKTMTADLTTTIDSLSVQHFRMAQTTLHTTYKKGNLMAQLIGKNGESLLQVDANVQDVMSVLPTYQAQLTTQKLDLSPILSNQSLKSQLNLHLTLNGKGLTPQDMDVETQLYAQPSTLLGCRMDTLSTQLAYTDENIMVKKLHLDTETLHLKAKGNYAFKKESDLQGMLQIKSGKELSLLTGIEGIETNGTLTFSLLGNATLQQLSLHLDMAKTNFSTLKSDHIKAKVNAQLTPNDTTINAQLNVQNLIAGNLQFDAVAADIASDIEQSTIEMTLDGKQLQTALTAQLHLGKETTNLQLDRLNIDYGDTHWRLKDTLPPRITLDKGNYQIDHFSLQADSVSHIPTQRIAIAGRMGKRYNEQKMDISLSQLHLPSILQLLGNETPLLGYLQLHASVGGTAHQPLITLHTHIDKPAYQQYKLQQIETDIAYANDRLQINTHIAPNQSGNLTFKGHLPLAIRLDSMHVAPLTDASDTLALDLLARAFPLDIINAFYPMDEMKGYLQSDIHIGGTWKNPNPMGQVSIKKGKAILKKYGINFPHFLATIHLEKENIQIDTVQIHSPKGTLTANGKLDFNSHFYKGDLQQSDIKIKLDHFQPLSHKYYNMELSGNAQLKGEKDSVYFSGDLNVLQALAYLPAITQLIGTAPPAQLPKPILITEMEKKGVVPTNVTAAFRPLQKTDTTTHHFDYFDQLRGKLNVYIPRNTWIKNEQMRIELSGDIELIKHFSFVELFGTVDVIRGQYEMLGKIFKIKEGTLTFQGGENINPLLDIIGVYEFRDQNKLKKRLQIEATGELSQPNISFTLDKQPINEGDAISYILFGTNMDALGTGEQDALASASTQDLATTLAASLLSTELTKILGKTFNVDYIEMRTGNDFENATFVVGKYITNKLFMSYERRFGNFEEQNIAPYEVKLEYELWRFLFLQLVGSPMTNGVDMIFKIDSKTDFKE